MEEKANHSFNEEFIYPDDRNSSLIEGNNENNIFYDEIFKSTFNCKGSFTIIIRSYLS